MFKSANVLSLTCSAVLLVMTITACTMKKEEEPKPEPEPKPTEYLLQTISEKDLYVDSFVYKNDLITERWLLLPDGFKRTYKYTYDSNGKVIAGETSDTQGDFHNMDSIVWNGAKATQYTRSWFPVRNAWVATDTTVYTVDAMGKMTKFAYADTVLFLGVERVYKYTEFTYNNNNNVTQSHYRRYSSTDPVSNSFQTMEYGSYDNPLALYLSKNPLLAERVANLYGNYILSYHNVTKLTWDDEVYMTAATTPAQGTNNIGILSRNRGGYINDYKYSYIIKP
ncbi:hypothetical protein [Chitinophaga arvensicola]|uniref:YD repeat-containing protein n=1 Tax=Chitinophaga arvensicola TaxID=29529 RepID=A0A1I0S8H6_9BACT|nr:hypothetical protein [Chitinophaga arvensicola]SEW52413.1 YD repeat-containing protein [Chitinophaga arvensicola]